MDQKKFYQHVIVIFFILIIIGILLIISNKHYEVTYVKSPINGIEYLVRDTDDKLTSAEILGNIHERINTLKKYLLQHINEYPEFKNYMLFLCKRIESVELLENALGGKYTSYTINKGQEIVLCIRSKIDDGFHDINLIMYVVLHELAHIACPEIGHTKLFKKIFIFLLKISIKIDIYKQINFRENPEEYCGMTINENLLEN